MDCAEEENISNSLEENTTLSLQNVIRKQEQSYDNFVSNFRYLTTDDIKKNSAREKMKRMNMTNPVISNKTTVRPDLVDKSNEDRSKFIDTEDIEEEVLGEGIRCSSGSGIIKNESNKKFTKFDNFIDNEEQNGSNDNDDDDDDDDDDLEDIGSGYTASFHADNYLKKEDEIKPTVIWVERGSCESVDSDDSNSKTEQFDTQIVDCPYKPDETGYLLNPGEVEDELNSSNKNHNDNITYLQYSCQIADSSTSTNSNEPCSDDVVPFVLDEDFDYDNILSTPKYNTQEMNYLMSFRQQTSEGNS